MIYDKNHPLRVCTLCSGVALASEDCGYSVESVAVHISLERYYSYQTMFYLAVYQTSMMQ